MTKKQKVRNLKQVNEIRHAAARFEERYGIIFTRTKRREAIEDIQNGRSKLVKVVSHGRTIHEIIVDNMIVKIVYDKNRHEIVTVLPAGDKNGENEIIYAENAGSV